MVAAKPERMEQRENFLEEFLSYQRKMALFHAEMAAMSEAWFDGLNRAQDDAHYRAAGGGSGGGGYDTGYNGGSPSDRTGTNQSENGVPTPTDGPNSNTPQTNNEPYGPPEPQPMKITIMGITFTMVTNIIPEVQEQYDYCLATVLHILNNTYNKNPLSDQTDIYNMDDNPEPGTQRIDQFILNNGYEFEDAVRLNSDGIQSFKSFINQNKPIVTFETINPPINGIGLHAVLFIGYAENKLLNINSFIYINPGNGSYQITRNFNNFYSHGFILRP